MTNRRVDAVYLALLATAVLAGTYLANRSTGEGRSLDLPDFELRPPPLEESFEFPYSIVKSERLLAPSLELSDDLERVLAGVRSALLESSVHVVVEPAADAGIPPATDPTHQLVASAD